LNITPGQCGSRNALHRDRDALSRERQPHQAAVTAAVVSERREVHGEDGCQHFGFPEHAEPRSQRNWTFVGMA